MSILDSPGAQKAPRQWYPTEEIGWSRTQEISWSSTQEIEWVRTKEILQHGNGGCKYTATAMHSTKGHAEAHEKMGFSQGWGIVVEQLVNYVKTTQMN